MEEMKNNTPKEELPEAQSMQATNKRMSILLIVALGTSYLGIILSDFGGALEPIGILLELVGIVLCVISIVKTIKNRSHADNSFNRFNRKK